MKRLLICLVLTSCFIQSTAFANGFSIFEQSASSLGTAAAGSATIAEDASTIFFNPAGLSFLPDNMLTGSLQIYRPSINFTNNGSTASPTLGSFPATGNNGGDAGDLVFAPNLFYSKKLNDQYTFGLGIFSPLGLKTEYSDNWVGRYQNIKSDLKTFNINPSISFTPTETVAVGFGVSAMYSTVTLTNAVDFGSVCAAALGGCGIGATSQGNDGKATIKGDDWGFGWNTGVIWDASPQHRFGLAYRSQIHQKLEGTVNFSNVPAAFALSPALTSAFANGAVNAQFVSPDVASFSYVYKINDDWKLLTDITWTNWSKFTALNVNRANGSNLINSPRNWDDNFRFAVGTSYQYSEKLKLRTGLAIDNSPINDPYRTADIPTSQQIHLGMGFRYNFAEDLFIDTAYQHTFISSATLSKTNDAALPLLQDKLVGSYDNSGDVLSIQLNKVF